jgi:hypothetical protein
MAAMEPKRSRQAENDGDAPGDSPNPMHGRDGTGPAPR